MPVDPHLKPDSSPAPTFWPREFYAAQSSRIRQDFETTGDGPSATREHASLADRLLTELYRGRFPDPEGPEKFCLVALGGYGRGELYPHSDIDLLFLAADDRAAAPHREAVAVISRALWDLRLRVGSTLRTLAESSQLHRDNLEFNIALVDARYLAGDARLFARLRDRALPRLVAREAAELARSLVEMTRLRHEKYGNTIFHLEPNLKETPGGLRDYHVARWLTLITQLERRGSAKSADELGSYGGDAEGRQAFDYLSATRCFLHYHYGRDDNQLSYELQDRAAATGIGHRPGERIPPEQWMRHYFRHARTIYRRVTERLEESAPARASLSAVVRVWKSRLSDPDFSVVRARIVPRRPGAGRSNPRLLLRMFELVARHGLELSREADRWVAESLPCPGAVAPRFPELWSHFREILRAPHASQALRAMHRLGLLVALFPEFHAIDALVVRDFYHRYTVDEHSLIAIRSLEALRPVAAASDRRTAVRQAGLAAGRRSSSAQPADVWRAKFGEILSELEQPELLFLALLFHDVGKGMPAENHITGSLEALAGILDRLEFAVEDRETVSFLVAQHLEMSATLQRRDVFDPETVRAFAEQVGTVERLKMLCLLTYADIRSVNPEALTPWKAEMLWQLYVATANYLIHSLDEERLHVRPGSFAPAERILPLVRPPATEVELDAFLEGFPKRYLAAHSPEEIALHFERARQLPRQPVQVSLRSRHPLFELTVLAADRPLLFASITGTLAAWGMNIVKADAFANSRGTILDTFRFADLFRTLELNPSEVDRFTQSVADVLSGRVDLDDLMRSRYRPQALPRPKVKIKTEVRFDDTSSTHSTLLELITQDHPGLLYAVSSALAELGCNIEVALIDTEGQKVIDVFYLTRAGAKLDREVQEQIHQALLARL